MGTLSLKSFSFVWDLEMRVRKDSREHPIQHSRYSNEQMEAWTSPPTTQWGSGTLFSNLHLLTSSSVPFLTPCYFRILGSHGVEQNTKLWGTSSLFSRGGDVTLPCQDVLTCLHPGSPRPKEIWTGRSCLVGEGRTDLVPIQTSGRAFSFLTHSTPSQVQLI